MIRHEPATTSWIVELSLGPEIIPPVQQQTDKIKNGEPIQGILRRRRFDLLTEHLRYDKRTVSSHRGSPAECRACLLFRENHSNGTEGGTIADSV